jgi:N-formylglutamate amidohydrolase
MLSTPSRSSRSRSASSRSTSSRGSSSRSPCFRLSWFRSSAVLLILAATSIASSACSASSDASPAAPPSPTPTLPAPPAAATGPQGPLAVGQVYTDRDGYVEYTPGDAPLVLVAPHGGAQTPSALPDRSCSGCVTVTDLNSQELARAVADTFYARTGARPHLVVNRLHRRKFDGNRDREEATGGERALDTTWLWMHAAIDSARQRVSRAGARGILIDVHGHGHDVQRLELGYLLSAATLRQTDVTLTATAAMGASSVAQLATTSRSVGDRGVALLRGPNSLGALLAARGVPAVPSPGDPAPRVGEEYFTGGYNTDRHGSRNGSALDAIQIESHFAGIRDSAASRGAFARALVDALLAFLERHYGWTRTP